MLRAPRDLTVRLAWGPGGSYNTSAEWEGRTYRALLTVDIEGALASLRRSSTLPTREIMASRVPPAQGEPMASRLGTTLFNALFTGSLREAYALSRGAAERAGTAWRLVLVIDADPLGRVPWELLFDPDPGRRRFLACSDSVVRRPSQGGRAVAKPRARRLHITWVAASPDSFAKLDLAREREVLDMALSAVPEAERPAVVAVTPPSPSALFDLLRSRRADPELQDREAHVLHLSCHGDLADKEGMILLSTPEGGPHPVSASTLAAAVLEDRSLRLVVINACNGAAAKSNDALTSVAALLSAQGVPAVIGMQTPVLDAFAVQLTGRLYAGLARGERADEALRNARNLLQVEQAGWVEQGPWAAPVLWLCGEGAEAVVPPPEVAAAKSVAVANSKAAAPPSPAPQTSAVAADFDKPPDVVYLCAPEDEEHRAALAKHLKLTLKTLRLTDWHAGEVPAGADVEATLGKAVALARVVILLVSNDYLIDPLREKAEASALERKSKREISVIPVYLRPIDGFEAQPFGRLKYLPKDKGPSLVEQPNRDAAWAATAAGVNAALKALKPRPSA